MFPALMVATALTLAPAAQHAAPVENDPPVSITVNTDAQMDGVRLCSLLNGMFQVDCAVDGYRNSSDGPFFNENGQPYGGNYGTSAQPYYGE